MSNKLVVIQNYQKLAKTKERDVLLLLLEAALSRIRMETILGSWVTVSAAGLTLQDQKFPWSLYRRVFLLGFGKGSAAAAKILEEKLGEKLTAGWVIDVTPAEFTRIKMEVGTHPLPSTTNLNFTMTFFNSLNSLNSLDLVLVVVCGGGSALLCLPDKISLEKKIAVNQALLTSGATIQEMNIIRKHLSRVKGGGLAKALYPATVAGLLFSDVPGNDLSTIASGPTVLDPTTVSAAWAIAEKYQLPETTGLTREDLNETPKEDIYFQAVHNFLLLSNRTALSAMAKKAQILGYSTRIFSANLTGQAREIGRLLVGETAEGTILLAGGETTVTVTGSGQGGRNQELVLGALPPLPPRVTIASLASDGWDNSPAAGAIADQSTKDTAHHLGLKPQSFLENNDSFSFFEKTGDAILTGRLPNNVSDLMVVVKS